MSDKELEKHLGEEGRADIYLDALKLNIEVKLDSTKMSKKVLKDIKKQVDRYKKHNKTVVVSLNGKPEGWDSDCLWYDPNGLFDSISDKT